MTEIARVNAGSSRLNAALKGYLFGEFWQPVDHDCGPLPEQWPNDVRESLLLAMTKWRATIGRIHEIGRTYACLPFEGRHACAIQIIYARVRQESVSPASSHAGEAGGSRPDVSPATAPAGAISPSLCGNDW